MCVYSMPIYASTKTCKTYNIKALPKHLDPHKHITATSTAKLAVSRFGGVRVKATVASIPVCIIRIVAPRHARRWKSPEISNEWQTTIFGICMVYYL